MSLKYIYQHTVFIRKVENFSADFKYCFKTAWNNNKKIKMSPDN